MIRIVGRPVSLVVLCAIALHFTWATLLAFDNSATDATAVAAIHFYIKSVPLLIAVFTGASICAIFGIFTRVPIIVILLMPQQILLLMSMAGCIEAIWLGRFADGIARPFGFIAADQAYSVILAIGHTIAIITHARRVVR